MGGDASGLPVGTAAGAPAAAAADPALDLADVQGFIMRSYTMPALRLLVLRVRDAARARQLLGALVRGDASPGVRLTSAAPWVTKPPSCVNVGLTSGGLTALGVPDASLASFPAEFVAGATARADVVGDTGASAPAGWLPALDAATAHVLLFVFADGAAVRDAVTAELRAACADGGFDEIGALDADALPGDVAHFGYRDGFSQPTIAGGLPPLLPDMLPPAPCGEFLLGYPSQYDGFGYAVPVPADLGRNGSFAAVRILEQDCDAFEQFLRAAAAQSSLDPELIAAKLCGRWRNGVPLALSPDTSVPAPPISLDQMNRFDYAPTDAHPEVVDDRHGYRCPIGAHTRRTNPRHATVAGAAGLKRRVMRRGLPYGPPYDPAHPHDGQARGLLGLFIGVSLKDQFEFVMSDWVNDGAFAPGLGATRDPLLGDNAPEASRFVIPVEGRAPVVLTGFSRFVRTRGGAYCFLPSITALRYVAQLDA